MAEMAAAPFTISPELTQQIRQLKQSIWSLISNLHDQLGDPHAAITALEKVLLLNPSNADARARLGRLLLNKESYPQAISNLRAAVNLSPDHPNAWAALAHSYLMTDDLDNAYQAYHNALAKMQHHHDPVLWFGIAILYDRYGMLEKALEAFHSVLTLAPNFERAHEVYYYLSLIYKEQHNYPMAHSYISRVVHADPQQPFAYAEALYHYAHVQELMGNQTAAMDAYHRSLSRDSRHLKSLQGLAWLTFKASNLEEAKKLLNHATQLAPNDAYTFYLIGRIAMAATDYRSAYDNYQQAVYRDGKNANFWFAIGILYFHMRQHRDAMDAYTRAIRINAQLPDVWYDMATLYEIYNQFNDAVDAYQRVIHLQPNDTHAKQRLATVQQAIANNVSPPAPNPSPRTEGGIVSPNPASAIRPHIDPANLERIGPLPSPPRAPPPVTTTTSPPSVQAYAQPPTANISTPQIHPIQEHPPYPNAALAKQSPQQAQHHIPPTSQYPKELPNTRVPVPPTQSMSTNPLSHHNAQSPPNPITSEPYPSHSHPATLRQIPAEPIQAKSPHPQPISNGVAPFPRVSAPDTSSPLSGMQKSTPEIMTAPPHHGMHTQERRKSVDSLPHKNGNWGPDSSQIPGSRPMGSSPVVSQQVDGRRSSLPDPRPMLSMPIQNGGPNEQAWHRPLPMDVQGPRQSPQSLGSPNSKNNQRRGDFTLLPQSNLAKPQPPQPFPSSSAPLPSGMMQTNDDRHPALPAPMSLPMTVPMSMPMQMSGPLPTDDRSRPPLPSPERKHHMGQEWRPDAQQGPVPHPNGGDGVMTTGRSSAENLHAKDQRPTDRLPKHDAPPTSGSDRAQLPHPSMGQASMGQEQQLDEAMLPRLRPLPPANTGLKGSPDNSIRVSGGLRTQPDTLPPPSSLASAPIYEIKDNGLTNASRDPVNRRSMSPPAPGLSRSPMKRLSPPSYPGSNDKNGNMGPAKIIPESMGFRSVPAPPNMGAPAPLRQEEIRRSSQDGRDSPGAPRNPNQGPQYGPSPVDDHPSSRPLTIASAPIDRTMPITKNIHLNNRDVDRGRVLAEEEQQVQETLSAMKYAGNGAKNYGQDEKDKNGMMAVKHDSGQNKFRAEVGDGQNGHKNGFLLGQEEDSHDMRRADVMNGAVGPRGVQNGETNSVANGMRVSRPGSDGVTPQVEQSFGNGPTQFSKPSALPPPQFAQHQSPRGTKRTNSDRDQDDQRGVNPEVENARMHSSGGSADSPGLQRKGSGSGLGKPNNSLFSRVMVRPLSEDIAMGKEREADEERHVEKRMRPNPLHE